LLHYMEIIRFATTKWGGFGWRAYDKQFRVLLSRFQNTKCWSVIDQNMSLLCVTVPSVTKTSNSSNQGGLGPKKNGAFLKRGPSGNQKSKGGSSNGNANGRKGGANQSGPKPVCRDYQIECVPERIVNFPMFALGAKWPTWGTKATTNGENSQSQNGGPIQNGAQLQNGAHFKNGGHIRNNDFGLPLQQPLSRTTPLSVTISHPITHNMIPVEVRMPPQHMELHVPAAVHGWH
jgi:hypothetical protein